MTTCQTTNSKDKKKYLLALLVSFSNVVCLIPYMASDYYNQFISCYGMTDGQLGWLLSAFGAAAIPGYFIGGWVADVFNAKKLVVFSCIGTSVIGIIVANCSSFSLLAFLFFLFGITGVVTYWSAFLKVVKMLGNDDVQGKLFALTDIGYAVMSILLQYTVVGIMTYVLRDNPEGFKVAYYIYAGFGILIGILIWFLVPNVEYKKDVEGGLKENVKLMGYALKNPITWYLAVFTLGYFLIRSVLPTYVNPYLTDAFGVSVAVATLFTGTARQLCLLVFSPVGGILRDKMGKKSSKLINYFAIGCIVFSVGLAFVPQVSKYAVIIMILYILALSFNGNLSNFLYTLVANAGVPLLYVGSVFGVASAIGYSSDLWLYNVCGSLLDSFGNDAYRYIMLIAALGGVLVLAMGYIVDKKYGIDAPVKNAEVPEKTE